MSIKNSNRWMTAYFPWAIFTLAILIRYFFIFEWHLGEDFIFSDMKIYFKLAEKIVSGSITQEHFFQPIGLPLIEGLILTFNNGSLSWLSWLHFLTSVATLFFIWQTTKKLTNSYLALLALGFSSFHYPFIFISGTYLSECLFAFALSFIIWLLAMKTYPWKPAWTYLLGLVVGLSLWLKGTFVFYLPVFALWLLIKNFSSFTRSAEPRKEVFRQFKPLAILFAGTLTMMMIHGLYSYSHTNEFLLSPTNGGLNFMEGKCPWKKNVGPDGFWWKSPLYAQVQENETRTWTEPFYNSSFYFNQGLECIKKDPMVLARSFQSIPYLFINNDFWPSLNTRRDYQSLSRNYSLFFALWLLPALFFALLYLLKNQATDKILVWALPVLTIFLTVWVFKSEVRMRVPFDVVFVPLGIWGWDLIVNSVYPELTDRRRYKIQAVVTTLMAILVSSTLIWP